MLNAFQRTSNDNDNDKFLCFFFFGIYPPLQLHPFFSALPEISVP